MTPFQAIVLSLSIQRPRYGYQIASIIEQGVYAAILNPNRTATYGALRRLEDLGYVTTQGEPTRGSRLADRQWDDRRRWYCATPQGLDAYRQWVTGKISDEPERAAVLARVALAGPIGTGALHKILDECEALCGVRERTLASVQLQVGSVPGIAGLCSRLVIAERRIALRGMREWTRTARDELRAYEQRNAAAAPQRRNAQQRPDLSNRMDLT